MPATSKSRSGGATSMDEQVTGVKVIPPESIARVLRRRAAEGDLWVPLEGSSMLPTVNVPAEGLVGAVRRPKWGEVWAFVDCGGSVTVHRALGRDRRGRWVMRGDGAPRTDAPVSTSCLVGPVQLIRRDDRISALARSRSMVIRLHLRRVSGSIRWFVHHWITQRRPDS